MSLPTIWTSKIPNDPNAKAQLEKSIRSSTVLIDRLLEILNDKEQSYSNTLFSLSTPKDIKEALIERIGEVRDLKKLLTFS